MFRVRVVRDVRAKLCASRPGALGLAPDPCSPAPPAHPDPPAPDILTPYNIAKTIIITAITAQVVLCSLTICGI